METGVIAADDETAAWQLRWMLDALGDGVGAVTLAEQLVYVRADYRVVGRAVAAGATLDQIRRIFL